MSGLRETHKRPARALDILVGLFAVCVAALVILAAVHHVGRTLLERRAAIEAERARGSATLFPSYLLHRVTPVEAGERHSMTIWAHGPAFR